MRITYVLAQPELGGGNKVVFQHARLLVQRGHQVTVLAEGENPAWARFEAPYVDYRSGLPALPSQDLVIATFWTTVQIALELGAGPVAHFCQGYEGGLVHLRSQLAAIDATYCLDLPTLTVSPHLQEMLARRFRRVSRVVPPSLDPLFRPTLRLRPRRRPWVAIPGIFDAEVKGVPTALAAVARLRQHGLSCRVLRFSMLPLSEPERTLLEPERYLWAASPETVAAALRRCDLLFFPSRPEEGFGLPLLEAMASKVPAVASRIPSTLFMSARGPSLVPVGDSGAFAEAALGLLIDRRTWRRARREGYEASRRFVPEAVAPLLEDGVRWASEQAGTSSTR